MEVTWRHPGGAGLVEASRRCGLGDRAERAGVYRVDCCGLLSPFCIIFCRADGLSSILDSWKSGKSTSTTPARERGRSRWSPVPQAQRARSRCSCTKPPDGQLSVLLGARTNAVGLKGWVPRSVSITRWEERRSGRSWRSLRRTGSSSTLTTPVRWLCLRAVDPRSNLLPLCSLVTFRRSVLHLAVFSCFVHSLTLASLSQQAGSSTKSYTAARSTPSFWDAARSRHTTTRSPLSHTICSLSSRTGSVFKVSL